MTGVKSRRREKKIAVLYPVMMGGGAEAVCVWALQALQEEYEVNFFTLLHIDLAEVNAYFGTRLDSARIRVHHFFPAMVTEAARKFFSEIPCRGFRQDLLRKRFLKEADRYDLALSLYNEMDMGEPGIQYVHNVGVIDGQAQASRDAYKKNRTLVNSVHTRDNVEREYGVTPEIVYPPVFSGHRGVDWDSRDNSFICLGRLVSAKMSHRAINVLRRVRSRGHKVDLHIIGAAGEARYMRLLEKMRREDPDWVFIHKDASRQELDRLLETSRFGIHIKPEPFGIVPAEMYSAGVIPFVRRSQGLLEVVGDREELLFGSDEEAVERICAVLSSEKAIRRLREYL
ncbi:MAG: glycosyltransferase, partial [Candidatus Omnitrophica bacterium]|nr:glycosyltransferase [Candidatus Omnitrophota bacterium]